MLVDIVHLIFILPLELTLVDICTCSQSRTRGMINTNNKKIKINK